MDAHHFIEIVVRYRRISKTCMEFVKIWNYEKKYKELLTHHVESSRKLKLMQLARVSMVDVEE
jgi:hypothetical protein